MLLPAYERTGKYRPPSDPPHRLNFGKETWLLAHYADWRGPLYADETAWRRAFSFVRAFMQPDSRGADRNRWRLTRIFGSFGSLDPPSIIAQVKAGLLRQGFQLTDLDEMSATAVFHQTDSCDVMKLPEPYGKWLQSHRNRLAWKDNIDLNVEAHCRIHAEPRLIPPYGNRSYLDLTLSAPAADVLPRLHAHLAATLRTPALLEPGAERHLERDMIDSLRPLIESW